MADVIGNDTGTLYIVAGPLGNLEDITIRALNVLKSVDAVACEDTRISRRLLSHYQIQKRLLSCRSANEKASAQGLIKLLQQGQNIAYLSDAGTPSISDPGAVLVAAVRVHNLRVVPIPGPSALTCLLSVASVKGDFLFAGFLPHRGRKREERLRQLLNKDETIVLYESPHRIVKLLAAIVELSPTRNLFLAREMTKVYAEYHQGLAVNLLEKINNLITIKGEFSLLIYAEGG